MASSKSLRFAHAMPCLPPHRTRRALTCARPPPAAQGDATLSLELNDATLRDPKSLKGLALVAEKPLGCEWSTDGAGAGPWRGCIDWVPGAAADWPTLAAASHPRAYSRREGRAAGYGCHQGEASGLGSRLIWGMALHLVCRLLPACLAALGHRGRPTPPRLTRPRHARLLRRTC